MSVLCLRLTIAQHICVMWTWAPAGARDITVCGPVICMVGVGWVCVQTLACAHMHIHVNCIGRCALSVSVHVCVSIVCRSTRVCWH